MTPEQLQSARERLGLSIPKLAAALGITERTAYNWLAGRNKVPKTADLLVARLLRDQSLSAKGGKR